MNKTVTSKAALGTICSVTSWTVSKKEGETLHNRIWQKIYALENKLSPYIEKSDISAINRASGKHPVSVGGETALFIKQVLKYTHKCDGYFDPTLLPLLQLWGFGYKKYKKPGKKSIDQALKLCGIDKIIIEDTTVFISSRGAGIHPGGAAKGFVCECLKKIAAKKAILINLGGHIMILNAKKKIAIRNPLSKKEKTAAIIETEDESVVTSGINERCFRSLFKKYHHLIDPATGRPAQHNLASVTIVSDNSIKADIYATACFVMGIKKAREYIFRENLDALFMTRKKELIMTKEKFDNCFPAKGFKKILL